MGAGVIVVPSWFASDLEVDDEIVESVSAVTVEGFVPVSFEEVFFVCVVGGGSVVVCGVVAAAGVVVVVVECKGAELPVFGDTVG